MSLLLKRWWQQLGRRGQQLLKQSLTTELLETQKGTSGATKAADSRVPGEAGEVAPSGRQGRSAPQRAPQRVS
jgi:hypothetical protein